MNRLPARAARALLLSAVLLPAAAPADDGDSWEFGAGIYGWFPDISGRTEFPNGGGGDFTIGIGDILDNLEFTFQAMFDARKGNWGFFTDVVYLDVSKSEQNLREGTIGGTQIPADVTASVRFDMKSLIWTAAGYYRMVDREGAFFDVLAGLRYADLEQSLSWSLSGNIGQLPLPGREGGAKLAPDYWDFILGLRGRGVFGQNGTWFIPYYADFGTGDSDLTVQAFAGIGYAFSWGEVVGGWRYLEYDPPSDAPIREIDFSGPLVGVAFRW
jgi:hypothetical protein